MINIICNDIKKAVDYGVYISALTLALTLPDWCGKAEYPGESTASRYKKWYSEYIGKYETYEGHEGAYLSADMVYSLRNHLLHQGTLIYDNKDVRQDQNKVDSFCLYFNHNESECGITTITKCGNTGAIKERTFEVNALSLIMKLKQSASISYKNNRDKFEFLDIKFIKR